MKNLQLQNTSDDNVTNLTKQLSAAAENLQVLTNTLIKSHYETNEDEYEDEDVVNDTANPILSYDTDLKNKFLRETELPPLFIPPEQGAYAEINSDNFRDGTKISGDFEIHSCDVHGNQGSTIRSVNEAVFIFRRKPLTHIVPEIALHNFKFAGEDDEFGESLVLQDETLELVFPNLNVMTAFETLVLNASEDGVTFALTLPNGAFIKVIVLNNQDEDE